MPSPSKSLATLRPDIAGSFMEYELAADQQGFIAHRVLPVFEVAKKSGTFGRIPIEQLLQKRETLRGPGGAYNRGAFTFEDESYGCQEHGLEEPVDDTEAEMYAEYFDAEETAGLRAFDAVLRSAEERASDTLFNATTFTPRTVTNEWDDFTNATPVDDVEAAVRDVWEASGLWPNGLILNRLVFRNLRFCEQIIEKIASSGAGQSVKPGKITVQQLAEVFDLDQIIVAGTPKNTADEGQSVSIAPIWSSEYAMVARIATRPRDIREPCLGRTFHWGEDGSQIGGTVESYRDEGIRSDVIRVRHDVHEKILYVAAAKLLDNITT